MVHGAAGRTTLNEQVGLTRSMPNYARRLLVGDDASKDSWLSSELTTSLLSISMYHHNTRLSEKQRVDRRVTYRFSSQTRLLLLQHQTPIAVWIACHYR
jgi:hypothetical protein